MATGSKQLVSISACVAYFSERGREVHRATISRLIARHGIKVTMDGRKKLVDPAEVWNVFKNDYSREVMSGEASGATQPGSSERHSPAPQSTPESTPPAPAPQAPAAAPDAEPDPAPVTTRPPTAAEQEKLQRVRQLKRENDLAEGRLVPVAEVHAGLAAAVAEMRATWKRLMREHVDKVAGELRLETGDSIRFKALTNEFLAKGQNVFAAELSKLIEAKAQDAEGVGAMFAALTTEAAERLDALNVRELADVA